MSEYTEEDLLRLERDAERIELGSCMSTGSVKAIVANLRELLASAKPDPDSEQFKELLERWHRQAYPVAVRLTEQGGEFTSSHIWNALRAAGVPEPPHRKVMLTVVRRLVKDGYAIVLKGKRARGGPDCNNGSVNVYQGLAL